MSIQSLFSGQVPCFYNLDSSLISGQNMNRSMSQQPHQQKNRSKQASSERKDQSTEMSHFKTSDEMSHFKTSDEMSRLKTSYQMSHLKTSDEYKQKMQRQTGTISLIPQALATKTQSRKEQITIYFFNSDKRMSFQKQQVNKYFTFKENISIRQFIPFVVKSYCRLILNFEPRQISEQTFQLKLANFDNYDDGLIDPYSHDLLITHLYDANNLVLVRKDRSSQKINGWSRLFVDKADLQIVEILMPEKKELTLQVQRTKSVKHLKQKLSSYTNQFDKIVLVSYYSFKICQNKRRIVDLDQRILQVYRQRVQDFMDKPTYNTPNNYNFTNVNYYQELWRAPTESQCFNFPEQQFYVNQTSVHGKLTLSLSKTKIVQKYVGGAWSAFPLSWLYPDSEERVKTYSIHTLIGIRNTAQQDLILKFLFKNRVQIKTYRFQYPEKKENFLRSILKIGRIYNKKWDKLK